MFTANSLLFVPGSRPDRFEKARASGAGLVVIDLEDAVGPTDKDSARAAALETSARDPAYGIRINGVATRAGIADLHHLAEAERLPDAMMVPMVEDAAELGVVAGALGDRCPVLMPLVETPRGLRHALAIASHPKVGAVMLGGADFSGELGVELAWEPLLAARQQLILACAEARKPAIDAPYAALDDDDGFAQDCRRAKAIGFAAKSAIHPRQVPIISGVFEPSDDVYAEAVEALKAYEEAGEKAIRHKGRMLEAPLVKNYRAVVARKEGRADA